MNKRILLILALSFTLGLGGCAMNEQRPVPSNQVVLILDGSMTFRGRRAEAMARASALLDSISQTKTRRWEQGAFEITIISLDAMPEVIWKGALRDLKAMKQSDWAERFKARSDYERCTDVDAAFKLATNHLEGDPQYVSKYIFAFTDLIHEPPMGSIRTCTSPTHPSVPSEEFPWAALQDVSVSIFWVPPDQKLAWQRVAGENGLDSSFALYTSSESGHVKLSPPPKPEIKISEADRAADREKYTSTFFGVLKWAGLIAVAFVVLVVILVTRNRKRQQATPGLLVPPLPPSKLRRPPGVAAPAGVRPPTQPRGQQRGSKD